MVSIFYEPPPLIFCIHYAALIPLADALAAMAEVLTTFEGQQQERSNTAENKNIQKQLDYLNTEIKNLKKQVNYHNL